MFDEIKEDLAEINPFALLAVGLEDALIGYTLNHHEPIRAVYDYNKCLQVLMERDGMDAEGADEFLSFNAFGAFVGTAGPLYVRLPAKEESPPPVPPFTDEEREAIATAIAECESMPVAKSRVAADTLRSLLERLK